MGPPAVSLVLVVLGLNLSAVTMNHVEISTAPVTPTSNITREDIQCSYQDGTETTISYQREASTALPDTPAALVLNDNFVYRGCQDVLACGATASGFYTISLDRVNRFIAYCDLSLDGGGWTYQGEDSRELVLNDDRVYRGCQDALACGATTSGLYIISLDRVNRFIVYCNQRLDGGGWTVFQNRYDGSVNFYNDWNTYKYGFGSLRGEFWLGNDKLYHLTRLNDQQLKIQLTTTEGDVEYADYSSFWVADESDDYRLNITGYSGGRIPGDAMAYHNGFRFSTLDQDNDGKSSGACAEGSEGGWWYDKCFNADINGSYRFLEMSLGLTWLPLLEAEKNVMATSMMVRTKP